MKETPVGEETGKSPTNDRRKGNKGESGERTPETGGVGEQTSGVVRGTGWEGRRMGGGRGRG